MAQMTSSEPIIVVTSGEPAGIGPDICLDLAEVDLPCRVVVLGNEVVLKQRANLLNRIIEIVEFDPNCVPRKGVLEIISMPLAQPCEVGKLNSKNASYVLQLLDRAYDGVVNGEFEAMVTAPIHKGVINEGIQTFFSGHTEYLAEKAKVKQVVMMLASDNLRVALLTTHLPLKDVAAQITKERILTIVHILYDGLFKYFHIDKPRILLAGLNPHAGEDGHLGTEELEIMLPAVEQLRAQGINISVPLPADTLFQPFMLEGADAVLASYHDQGLPVLKFAGFGKSVNITLGLPFIRTSVDHGTALNLAGTGKAHSGSLLAAVDCAYQMSVNKRKY